MRPCAAEYCRLNPPRSPVLISYGATFPEFLAENVLQADLGCLHEVARLDTAWWEAYHAEEAIPLTPGEFAQQFEGEVGEVRAVFHPSVKFLEIGTFAQRSWQNARGVDAPANLESEIPQTVFVARPYADVIVHALPEESAQFLRLLVDGASIASAVEIMAEQITTFDAITQVQDLMNSKLITFLRPV